ncbi:MAG: hypothetical protein H0T72_12385 [Chloroflexia bacterium]|nr:hypothetical protein [Chloroflexia bacterium]
MDGGGARVAAVAHGPSGRHADGHRSGGRCPVPGDPGQDTIRQTVAFLAARQEQLRYQAFTDAGYPIGSGCVESANKLVMEARLKGAGMHWVRANVNSMLALRTLVANARWTEG